MEFSIGDTKEPYESGVKYFATIPYLVYGRVFEKLHMLSEDDSYRLANKARYFGGTIGFTARGVFADDFKRCEDTYADHKESVEDVILRLERETQSSIDLVFTLQRLCDILNTRPVFIEERILHVISWSLPSFCSHPGLHSRCLGFSFF